MPFARSLPVLAAVAVSAGLWFLGFTFMPAENGYAALMCSAAIPDREIVERLEAQGFTGLVSESGQWVLLDSFNAMERIPLDQYHGRLLPFDPRYDPYAEKLRSLFIRGETRVIYIPAVSVIPVFEKKVASALRDIPYTLEYSGRNSPAYFFPVVFFIAAAVFFIVRPLRRALRPDAACLIPCLIILAPLALGGAAGFAQASLLVGCAVLLAGPCLGRLVLSRRYSPGLRQGTGTARIPVPFALQLQQLRRLPLLLPFVLICCYGVIAWFSSMPLLFMALVFALFCGIFIFSLWGASAGGVSMGGRFAIGGGAAGYMSKPRDGHQRFSPVPILSRKIETAAFSWAMIPFAAMALILAFAAPGGESASPDFSFLPPSGIVTEEDYYRHYRFQASFSLLPLHVSAVRGSDVPGVLPIMSVYELDPDGLPRQIPVPEALPDDIPPFPLGDFLQYLDTTGTIRPATVAHERLFALLPLFFILPAVVRKSAPRHSNQRLYSNLVLSK